MKCIVRYFSHFIYVTIASLSGGKVLLLRHLIFVIVQVTFANISYRFNSVKFPDSILNLK